MLFPVSCYSVQYIDSRANAGAASPAVRLASPQTEDHLVRLVYRPTPLATPIACPARVFDLDIHPLAQAALTPAGVDFLCHFAPCWNRVGVKSLWPSDTLDRNSQDTYASLCIPVPTAQTRSFGDSFKTSNCGALTGCPGCASGTSWYMPGLRVT